MANDRANVFSMSGLPGGSRVVQERRISILRQNQMGITEFMPEISGAQCGRVGVRDVRTPGDCFEHRQVGRARFMEAGEQAVNETNGSLGGNKEVRPTVRGGEPTVGIHSLIHI